MKTVEVSKTGLSIIGEELDSATAVLDFVISEMHKRHERQQINTTDYQLAVMLEMIDHQLGDQTDRINTMLGQVDN